MGLFGPSKSQRQSTVAVAVVKAEKTFETLSDDQKDDVQAIVRRLAESAGIEQLAVFAMPRHHKWWFYAIAMERLGVKPVGRDPWNIVGDPAEFDEHDEDFQLALSGAEYVLDDTEKVTFLK